MTMRKKMMKRKRMRNSCECAQTMKMTRRKRKMMKMTTRAMNRMTRMKRRRRRKKRKTMRRTIPDTCTQSPPQ